MKILFATSNYQYLLDLILARQSNTGIAPTLASGKLETKKFPDGETYHRMDDVSEKQVVIIGGTTTDTETLELYDMACHCAKSRAIDITLVIPYFGYATMERAVKSGEIVKAKTRARLLSSIPANRMSIVFMDLHSEGTPHYLEGSIQPVHLYAKPIIIEMCRKISYIPSDDALENYASNTNFVLASTDAGRAKWVESLANEMGVECAVITKRRLSGTDTSIAGINADVKGKNVVIYDDMIRTGGSLIGAGQAYKDAGALRVFAVATHGVLPDESIYKLKASGVFEKIYVTNTHPTTQLLKEMPTLEGFFDVFDVSPVFYVYIR
jgi:ribose-phosphate pyrophosphokinase